MLKTYRISFVLAFSLAIFAIIEGIAENNTFKLGIGIFGVISTLLIRLLI